MTSSCAVRRRLAEKFALATRQYPESAAGLAISEKFGIDPQKRLALGCATEKRVVKNGVAVRLVVGFGFHDAIDGNHCFALRTFKPRGSVYIVYYA